MNNSCLRSRYYLEQSEWEVLASSLYHLMPQSVSRQIPLPVYRVKIAIFAEIKIKVWTRNIS